LPLTALTLRVHVDAGAIDRAPSRLPGDLARASYRVPIVPCEKLPEMKGPLTVVNPFVTVFARM
jgi:hypothetical protein